MKKLPQFISLHTFLTIGPYEQDEEFRKVLCQVAYKGMLVAGLLGVLMTTIFLIGHTVVIPKTMVWTYQGINAKTDLAMIDKSLIIASSVFIIALSRRSLSLAWCRRLIFFFVWLLCMAMVSDDIIAGDLSVSPAYSVLVLIIAAGTFPFTGWQTLIMNLSVLISIITAVNVIPAVFNWSVELLMGQYVYLFIVAIPLTGISSLIYINRYEQFRARRRAEELSRQLEERAHVLEMMKEKSEKQAEKILENEKLKDRFFANISHEFRTPLTLILGPVNDLMDGHVETDKPKVSKEVLRLIQKNGNRLLSLINQLLDLSKIDAGRIQINLQDTDLASLLRETVLSFSAMAERKKIDLNCSIEENNLLARVDPEQMERVIINLLSNALKFTPENGRVKVTYSMSDTEEGSICIKVSDTGIGIPAKDLPNIFDRFYQADHEFNPSNTGMGTGIGLALVKEVVELHGGTVHVRSTPGEGTEFIINLYDVSDSSEAQPLSPLKTEQRDLDAKIEATPSLDKIDKQQSDNKKEAPLIMLVDDNPDILAYLYSQLSERYRVILKERSSEALKEISNKNNNIELVISDLMMPSPDGFELCRTIKDNPDLNHIPVILLTAQADEEQRLEGLEVGADDYISKPFSAIELMARVENLIEIRRKLKEKFSEQLRLKGKEVEVSSADARFLKRVQSVIEKQMENSNFGVDWLADEVALSTRQLQRKIRAITDLSAGGYIRLIRLERASQLLSQEWGNVSEIAYKVGFQDAKYFSRLFKQTFGHTPTEYAEKEQ